MRGGGQFGGKLNGDSITGWRQTFNLGLSKVKSVKRGDFIIAMASTSPFSFIDAKVISESFNQIENEN